jgi:flagellar hook protein FlgE
LVSPAAGSNPTIAISGLADGANPMNVSFNLYDSAGNSTITQYAQASASASNTADGQAAGQLSDVAIGDGGVVIAKYSNGHQVALGQIAMANFSNPDSLLAVGNNSYQTTGATSNPAIGLANTGGRGQIQGSALESSTSDIATEFTNLMVNQRSYEANSKVITTADTLNQDVINLIR